MRAEPQFFGRYRAALLGYLSGNGEEGLACAYELGRMGIDGGSGLLQIVQVHHEAVNAILEATPSGDRRLPALYASEQFLMEALAPFDMASRGYLDLFEAYHRELRRESH
jgi:hypothetical protein